MAFKEAFEHYRSGTATPEEIAYVKEELEKNRLISQYFEDDFENDQSLKVDSAIDQDYSEEDPAEVLKKVRKSIRKRSRNIVVTSVAVIIVLTLFVHYAAAPLLNHLFYNPMTKTTDEYAYDIDFSFIAYTELHQAGIYYAYTEIKNTGIGKYDMTLERYNLIKNEPDYMPATIDKNKLKTLYSFTADNLPVNIFARASAPVYDLDSESKELNIKPLKQLPDYINVTAAVSFSEDLTMDRLIDMMDDSELYFMWAGIRNSPEDVQRYPLCGMDLTGAGPIYERINEKYPEFELSSVSSGDTPDASDYEHHFISLLQYTIDHPYISKALNVDPDYAAYYHAVLDYVKKNGVKTYGVMVKGSPKDILALMDSGVVSQIWTLDADVSF